MSIPVPFRTIKAPVDLRQLEVVAIQDLHTPKTPYKFHLTVYEVYGQAIYQSYNDRSFNFLPSFRPLVSFACLSSTITLNYSSQHMCY